jgi:hypothetical protein
MYNLRMYIMDIRNYTWVDTFEVIDNTNNKAISIVIGILAGILSMLGLSFIVFMVV